MPAITLIVNPDGSVSPGIVRTPGPNPTLDGMVVRPTPYESGTEAPSAREVVTESQNVGDSSTGDSTTKS